MKRNLLLLVALLTGTFTTNAQWLMQNSGFFQVSAYPYDISIADANTAWAVAWSGAGDNVSTQAFTKTIDGGNFWQSGTVTLDTNFRFACIHAYNGDTAWAMMYNSTAGSGGGVWKTNDGGGTWTQQSIFTVSPSFPDVVYFWGPNEGVAFGDPLNGYYEIYTTDDGGTTWTRVPQADIPAPLNASEFGLVNNYAVIGDTIWTGTNYSRMYKSTDHGHHWTVNNIVNTSAAFCNPVSFRNGDNGICVKTNTTTGALLGTFRTNDGGATWTQFTPTGTRFYFSEIKNIPGTDYYVNCSASTANGRGSAYSSDDGATWTLIDSTGSGTDQGYTSLQFLDFNTGWGGGFAVDAVTDGIYKWDPNWLSVKNTTPKAEHIAYPNPSTGVFNFNMPVKHTDLNISVIDVTGKEVFKTQYRNLSGIFRKSFDFTYLSSGVYYMIIDNGKERSQEKIVIQ
jgi:photosystem II stability/assembly factor-like uncharacterized protein